MDPHEKYMRRCLHLAGLGAGDVAPNPMVGAILVHGETIIGEGYHKKYGEAHAEVNCIASVANENFEVIANSCLYVSLEPCAHHGKTPPCADLIIKHKIPKVVVGCRDPFKQVDGKGIDKLRAAGVEVAMGVLEKECIELNKRFFSFHTRQRPYVILKWAQSFDGKIAAAANPLLRERMLISNEYTNRLVHKWRSQEAAILIGTNTALYDDPSLTTRLWKGNNPVRLVMDMDLRLPHSLRIFDKETRTVIFNKIKNEEEENLLYCKLEAADVLNELIRALYEMQIQSVLVEGGARLLQSLIDAGIWGEVRQICNNQLVVGDGLNAPSLGKAVILKTESYINDTITYFRQSS